jgi:hypothetical protein
LRRQVVHAIEPELLPQQVVAGAKNQRTVLNANLQLMFLSASGAFRLKAFE